MSSLPEPDDEDVKPAFRPRRIKDDAEMDITPMIDCTFLLLIFFLVCSNPSADKLVDLAPARHGIGVPKDQSVVITIIAGEGDGLRPVYLADGKVGTPLGGDAAAQEQEIIDYVTQGRQQGMQFVILKAERGVPYRELNRVGAAAGSVEGMLLNLAVLESD